MSASPPDAGGTGETGANAELSTTPGPADTPLEALRSGTRLEVRCEGMVHGGLCLAHAAGATLMVDGGIPGELVEVALTFRKGRTWFCRVVDMREGSPDRVDTP